ncbi:MAG TPA: NAD(P)-dependent oxidoreductase [Gemmatimonadales bacterium]|nr:NAD(P)-dependent oxidoreductase [Gemmatimonadales bacterium]
MRAAFLGLGAIGRPMAAHLARAHDLTVWNRSRPRAEEFARGNRATVAATPREAVTGAEVVLTCLPTSAEVEALLEGADGILPALTSGTLFLDCTSGDPESAARIARRLRAVGVAFADCPVSGGTNGAEAGALTVMVGADPATFARAQPVLACFGKRIEHLGPVGSGSALKAINNALLAANILAFGEGFAGLAKAGIPVRQALDVLNASSGRSFVTEGLVPERVLTGAFPNTFRLALLEKDVRIAVRFLESQGVASPLLHLVAESFRAARSALGEDADYLEAVRLHERQAGVEIRA